MSSEGGNGPGDYRWMRVYRMIAIVVHNIRLQEYDTISHPRQDGWIIQERARDNIAYFSLVSGYSGDGDCRHRLVRPFHPGHGSAANYRAANCRPS
jgi:hypothetical protein